MESYDPNITKLPSFNVFDALGIEKPSATLSIEDLLHRVSLITDLYKLEGLRQDELKDVLFPSPWQVTAAFSYLVSYNIQEGGPATKIEIDRSHLELALQVYGGYTYRRSFCPEQGSGGGKQRRGSVWPFFKFYDFFDEPSPNEPLSVRPTLICPDAEHCPTNAASTLSPNSQRNAALVPSRDLGDMAVNSGEGSTSSVQVRGVLARPRKPMIMVPDPGMPDGHQHYLLVVRSSAAVDSSESDEDPDTSEYSQLRARRVSTPDFERDHIPGTYTPGYCIVVGLPLAQAELPRERQQLVWATFTRKGNLVFTARAENCYGEAVPWENLLRNPKGRFVTAIRLRDIHLLRPWYGMSRRELQKAVAIATWTASLCGDNVEPLWCPRPTLPSHTL